MYMEVKHLLSRAFTVMNVQPKGLQTKNICCDMLDLAEELGYILCRCVYDKMGEIDVFPFWNNQNMGLCAWVYIMKRKA